MRIMTARYAGSCAGCGTPIKAGESIAYAGRRRVYHANCQPSACPRQDAEYYQGRQEGHQYSQNKKLYGEALAEAWEMEAELARYNRGDDY